MKTLYNKNTQAIFWNNNTNAIQRMMDYGFICGRETPPIAVIIHPTSQNSFQKFFYGPKEILIPISSSMKKAVDICPAAEAFLNFASFRSAYEVSMEALDYSQFNTIMITAEGIPERPACLIAQKAKQKNVVLIGPSTVGAVTPGSFKTGNIGGTIQNIVKMKMHRPGSVGLVTQSGGLFNELVNIISLNSNGIAEGVAIGGDRFPGTNFLDHLLRMEKNPQIQFNIVLGEVGGTQEYDIIKAKQDGRLKKPIIGLCIGTVAEHMNSGIQFGHAGAKANTQQENATYKNQEMKKAGLIIPNTFNDLPKCIKATYQKVKAQIKAEEERKTPQIPSDYKDAKKKGEIRKQTSFICTISDDRGEEAVYAGYPISQVAPPNSGFGIADVIALLWFKKKFPKWATDFIETVIKTVADHGPAVSGAHNAKVTTRAGKDIISALISGLVTIGPRFGGAIDGAAKYFKIGVGQNMKPVDFVSFMKKKGIPIPGIGHRIKSIKNPDLRVNGLIDYAKSKFPKTTTLDYALSIEQVTTRKKETLILNVDGTIGVLLVDMFRALKYSDADIEQLIESGTFNAFFVLGRSIGFIGHCLDEKRLKMPMYRHDLDDILYDVKLATEGSRK